MDGEVEKNNKKKQIILILVGVVTLLVAILGATYAYFKISTNNESSNTTITGSTPKSGLVTIKGVTDNLHINLKASDMSQTNQGKEYYGTDGEEPYVEKEEDGTKTIAEVELTGGEETTKYSCTAKLTVSKVTEPEEDKDTIINVLQPGDLILQFKGDIISEKLDLSELKETGTKEYDLKFKITGNATKDIQAYIKLINKDEPQKDLAGKKLNIDISTSELKCNVYIEYPTIAKLRENDENNTLSENIVGGMYRYQGKSSDEINNYICFGTNDKSKCACNADETCDDTKLDKYMYRIIGITEEGQLYLIKMKGVEEGENKNFVWNLKYSSTDCRGACEWLNADLYKRLNGEPSNGNPIFKDNTRYEYMQERNVWYGLIADHNWMYGDVDISMSNTILDGETVYGLRNNGIILYDIETGIEPTQHYENINDGWKYVKHQWSTEKNVPAKIGLMYLHDYYLAYDNERNWWDDHDTSNWINIGNNNNTTGYPEWLLSRQGADSGGDLRAYIVTPGGSLGGNHLNSGFVARPTFYLKSTTEIKTGTGSIRDPFILDVQE